MASHLQNSTSQRDLEMHVLLVEDDKQILDYASNGLIQAGCVVDSIDNGEEALNQCMQTEYDVLVVDRMLPGMDGLSLVKAARAVGIKTPVIFVTAVSGMDGRLEGLKAGGDDYLAKPFAFSELLARVTALGRRPADTSNKQLILQVADLKLDLLKRKVTRGGIEIDLKPKEFLLLEVLMLNEGRAVSRSMLLEQVWDFHFAPKTSVVETHISRLKSKIDKPFATSLLHNFRNIGYSLQIPQ